MVKYKKKSNKRKKKTNKIKIKTSKKDKIINVGFSNMKSKGTRATFGNINFHYQRYQNIDDFFDVMNIKNLSNIYHYIDVFIREKINIYPEYIHINKNPRLTICIVNISSKDNHANICLIDHLKKRIEYFEPHGYRRNKDSGFDDFGYIGSYQSKKIAIQKYFNNILSDYNFIDVVNYNRKTDYQALKDPEKNSGFCVTWCILFVHYRCLNTEVKIKDLMMHISKYITTNRLLKYAKYIEENLKSKLNLI